MGDFDTTIQNPTTSTGGITSGGGTTPVPANKPSIEDFFNSYTSSKISVV